MKRQQELESAALQSQEGPKNFKKWLVQQKMQEKYAQLEQARMI